MKNVFIGLIVVVLVQSVSAQGVGINETGADPHPSAGLELNFNNRGFLPPRLTTAERDAIQNPAEGLHIYNLTTKCVEVFYGTFWQNTHCGCSIAPSDLVFTDNGPLTYCLNQAVAINFLSTQGGNPSSYTVSPALPAGLFLNTTTGQLSGTPTATVSETSFTFTASNACGSSTRELSIGITTIPAELSAISGPEAPTINLSASYSITALASATFYTWTVPAGWTIDSGQGSTSIHVTVGTDAGNVTVTASNSCGTSSASTKAVTSWRPVVTTGGTITNYTANGSNGVNGVQYRVHSYTTVGSSNFNVTDAGTDSQVDYLIVAGGGGGGGNTGGGGGAGGVISGNTGVNSNTYTVTVGSGGIGGSTSQTGQNGSNSSFSGVTAIGGGRGATNAHNHGPSIGGSGGGGAEFGLIGASGTSGQGNNGGTATSWTAPHYGAGGGGGAGAPGGNGNSGAAGNGGMGIQSSITGTALFYGGGGGGGTYLGGTLGNGGSGGGGSAPAENGQPNTGGGGGGQINNLTAAAGSGASGIVIIRYPLTNPNQ